MARNDRVERATVATCNDLVLRGDDATEDDEDEEDHENAHLLQYNDLVLTDDNATEDDEDEEDHLLTLSLSALIIVSQCHQCYL